MTATNLGRHFRRWFPILCSLATCGCVAANTHLSGMLDTVSIHAKQSRDLASIRRDTRERLAEELEEVRKAEAQKQIEQARIDAQRRRLEMEFCIADQQQQQQQLENNVKQSIESKIAFKTEHGLEVGELEVDTEALKTLLEKRNQPPTQEQNEPKTPCACCDQPCGCRPGLLRRLCSRCSRKPCEAEKDCGGPARVAQLQQQPQKQPLKPAEIPLKLPVRLTFGIQQPQLEQTKITRKPPTQEQKGPCCKHCGSPGDGCRCPESCVDGAPKAPVDAPPGEIIAPPSAPPDESPFEDDEAGKPKKPSRQPPKPAVTPASVISSKRRAYQTKATQSKATRADVPSSQVTGQD